MGGYHDYRGGCSVFIIFQNNEKLTVFFFTLYGMLMYHLTQEVIIKLLEILILSTLDHHNFNCGFSQNFNAF